MDDYKDLERDAALQEPLAGLRRELRPDPAVEERLVAALRREGRLQPTRWYGRSVPLPLAAAAGFLLFAAGAVAGQRLAHRAVATVAPGPAATAPASTGDDRPARGGLIIRM